MNGIICINKPKEYTSFDVIARLKGMTKTKRIGHAGTLDPMATGVLPIFVGLATRLIAVLPSEDKEYQAKFMLGARSDTLDVWGNVEKSTQIPAFSADRIKAELASFCGEIEQMPPMYSAVQIGGRRLYDIARSGEEIERPLRKVTVHRLELLDFDEQEQTGTLDIVCSKGTYVRTIIADLGDKLGCGGIMTGLVRTKAAGFSLEDCITMEEMQQHTTDGTIEQCFIDKNRLFCEYPKIYLNPDQTRMYKNGVVLDLNRIKFSGNGGKAAVYDLNKNLLGISTVKTDGMELLIDKMLYWED